MKNIKLKSLKSNIILYLILFTIIPLSISTAVILYQMNESKKDSLHHHHKQILTQVIHESDAIINDIEDIGGYVKDAYPIKKRKLLTGLIRVHKNISSILILDNKGKLIDFSSKTESKLFRGYDFSNMSYFKSLTSDISSFWSDVYLSHSTNKPSLSYSVQINEKYIAVLVIDLATLDDFSSKFFSGDDSTMVRIVDNNGIFLANPDNKSAVSQRKSIKSTDIYINFIKKNISNQQIVFNGYKKVKNIGMYGVTKRLKWMIIVKERYNYVFDTLDTVLLFMLLFILILMAISIFFSLKLSKSILKPLNIVNKQIDDIAHGVNIDTNIKSNYIELEQLSKNFFIMQDKIQDREDENREKDKQLYNSIKMAQMGEMIGNIAHQWRQPLSVISTASSGMKMEKEFDMLDDDKFNIYCDTINKNTQYLSETIDTFRDFIKEKKELKTVVLQDRIDSALSIVSSSLANHFIKLNNKVNYENNINITMVVGELSQVIINICNNAKDILVEKKIDEPYITVKCYEKDRIAYITIEDNGGGVPEDIILKVFDPYFTTKHQSQGTGLGLHMSYKIITENLNGNIYIENTEVGAKFIIELPLK